MTDREIVEGCLSGNAQMMKVLYDTYSGRMMSLCLRYAGSRDEAKDILQDGFIKVFEKLSQFSGQGALSGWISTIMVNTALIHIRKMKREGIVEDIDDAFYLSNDDHSVLDKMGADELMKLIVAMPPGYRTVFNMFAIEGYSHREIAEELQITESTSKTQFKKAKAYLKKEILELESSP
jgi:RNA polymerase sigma factor (sigma-70 family)